MVFYRIRLGSHNDIRFFPVLAWLFALIMVGFAIAVVGELASGVRATDERSLGAIGLMIGFAAVVLFSTGDFVSCRFELHSKKVILTQIGIRGRRQIVRKLEDLRALRVVVMRKAYVRIELGFASGERIFLSDYFLILLSIGGLERLAERLNVPLESATGPQRRVL